MEISTRIRFSFPVLQYPCAVRSARTRDGIPVLKIFVSYITVNNSDLNKTLPFLKRSLTDRLTVTFCEVGPTVTDDYL